jgi:hypothetical protein
LYYFVVVRAAVKSVPLHYTDEWLDYDWAVYLSYAQKYICSSCGQ